MAKSRWSTRELGELIRRLAELRGELIDDEERYAGRIAAVPVARRASARNLVHYLALRRHDMRLLQERLAALGLSSLGRMEGHVLSSIDAVLAVLHSMLGSAPPSARPRRALDFTAGGALLEARTEALLGPAPAQRDVRIMVTMPSEAARRTAPWSASCSTPAWIACASTAPTTTPPPGRRMVANLRARRDSCGRQCRVSDGPAGPKLRTGPIVDGPRSAAPVSPETSHGQVLAAGADLAHSRARSDTAPTPVAPATRRPSRSTSMAPGWRARDGRRPHA